jgi:hypothetical protein
MSVKFNLSLFDADDLKLVEDMFAKAMTRAIVSALKIASRDGLLRPEAEPEPEPVHAQPDVHAPPEPIPERPEPVQEPKVPVFLKPPPEHPFPNGKAVEPPPLKRMAKTRKLYLKLYKTVADRPQGFITAHEAAAVLGENKSGQISMWLQKGELDAVIVANEKPPTKGLPGKLMISKDSVIARQRRVREWHRREAA